MGRPVRDIKDGIFLCLGLLVVVGWYGHVTDCVAANNLTFLVVGFVIPPLGIIHGWIVLLK
jgi:hypothetical protein